MKEIDNASGHYEPSGASAQSAAEKAFNDAGIDVPDGSYIEKVWSESTNRWEPAAGNGR